jgi:hypothetical protein
MEGGVTRNLNEATLYSDPVGPLHNLHYFFGAWAKIFLINALSLGS